MCAHSSSQGELFLNANTICEHLEDANKDTVECRLDSHAINARQNSLAGLLPAGHCCCCAVQLPITFLAIFVVAGRYPSTMPQQDRCHNRAGHRISRRT